MKIIIVGTGIASYYFASAVLKKLESVEVEAYGEEGEAYYRTRVLSLLDGKTAAGDLAIKPVIQDPRYSMHKLHVDNIDPDNKQIYTSDGKSHGYDVLVLANGAKAARLPLPGGRSHGIFAIRTIDDVIELSAWLDSHSGAPAVVIGGGLLGLEAASLIHERTGREVTVMESADHLLPRQLDLASSLYLQRRLSGMGLKVLCGASTSNFLSVNDCVSGIKCDDGFLVPASTVVESVGIRPNTFLAVDAGLQVSRGVVVDGQLRTSAENVYAIGDVAQFNGQVSGLAGGAMDMARTLAGVIAGEAVTYTPSAPSSMLKVAGLDVMTFGSVFERDAQCVVNETDTSREAWFVRDGVLAGVSMIGTRVHMSAARSSIGKAWEDVKAALLS